jgi:DNA processing protein
VFDQIKDLPLTDYPSKIQQALHSRETQDFIQKETEKANQLKINIISFNDSKYPAYCKHFKSMPPVLYCKGKIPFQNQCAAIVGSRKASAYGIKETIRFTQHLVKLGFSIISGLAYGIDAQTHKTCLDQQGTTYAVMGCGLDIDYPMLNKSLKDKISEAGVVLSEFPLGTPPLSYHFPVRNRIISALSKFILVIEASRKSGALITADYGLDQGKDVLAIPGNIDQSLSEGTNHLIKSGAVMINDIESIDDYLKNTLGLLMTNQPAQIEYSGCNSMEEQIINVIKKGTCHKVDIINKVNQDAGQILQALTTLEMKGYIKEINGEWVCID